MNKRIIGVTVGTTMNPKKIAPPSEKANAIKVTHSGETIVATDSAEAKFDGLRVFGRSEQASTTGAQLFDINADKIISNKTYMYEFTLKPNTPYTLSTNAPVTKVASLYFNGGSSNGNQVNVNIPRTITTDDTGYFFVYVRWGIDEGTDAINLYDAVLDGTYWIMLNEGDTPLPHEKFTGGKPSPSVEFQQHFESKGKDGSIDVKIYNSNLLDVIGDVESSNGTIKTVDGNCLILKTNTNATTEGTTYTSERYEVPISRFCNEKEIVLSIDKMESIDKVAPYIMMYGVDDAGERYNTITIHEAGSYIYSIHKDVIALRITVYSNAGEIASKGDGAIYTGLRINLGSKALPWEEHKKQTLSISTHNGLPAIKVTDASLATYTDLDGNMWVADEIDFARGKYIQRVKKVVFDGLSMPMERTDGYRTNGHNYAYKMFDDKKLGVGLSFMSSIGVSTRIEFIECVGSPNTNKSISVSFSDERTGITANDDKTTIISKINAVLQQIPVTVQYILDTPIETDLTTEQLEEYRALTSNYPTTTILNDCDAHMEVTLVADTKNYIDNKFAALAAQML